MAIDKRITYRRNFRGGGMDMGNTKSQAKSASMANTPSRNTSSGTGGSSGNIGGGGGGQGSKYRQYSPPTRPTYTSANIDSKPVTGADYRRSRNQFINKFNIDNASRFRSTPFNRTYKPVTLETFGSRPRGGDGLGNLFKTLFGFATGIPIGLFNKGKSGITSINNALGDFREKFTGYRTQQEYDDARQQRIDLNRINTIQNTLDTKYADGDYSMTDLDERLASLQEGLGITPNTAAQNAQQFFDFSNQPELSYEGIKSLAVPSSSYDMAGVNTPFAQQAPEEFVSQFLPEKDIYNQQTTKYQKRPEQVETDMFFSPQLKSEDYLMTNSDVAPEFQNMIMRASGTIGNYAQNEVSNQLYGKDYAVLNPFEQQQIDTAIETYGTKSTGELASGTDT